MPAVRGGCLQIKYNKMQDIEPVRRFLFTSIISLISEIMESTDNKVLLSSSIAS